MFIRPRLRSKHFMFKGTDIFKGTDTNKIVFDYPPEKKTLSAVKNVIHTIM